MWMLCECCVLCEYCVSDVWVLCECFVCVCCMSVVWLVWVLRQCTDWTISSILCTVRSYQSGNWDSYILLCYTVFVTRYTSRRNLLPPSSRWMTALFWRSHWCKRSCSLKAHHASHFVPVIEALNQRTWMICKTRSCRWPLEWRSLQCVGPYL